MMLQQPCHDCSLCKCLHVRPRTSCNIPATSTSAQSASCMLYMDARLCEGDMYKAYAARYDSTHSWVIKIECANIGLLLNGQIPVEVVLCNVQEAMR